jgi:hypothetical protein
MFDRGAFLSSLAGVAAFTGSSLPDVCQEILAHSPALLPCHTFGALRASPLEWV